MVEKNFPDPLLKNEENADETSSAPAEKLLGRNVSQKKLATLLGYDRNTVAKWNERGCPVVQRGDGSTGTTWIYDLSVVVKWLQDTAVAKAISKYQSSDGQDTEVFTKRKRGVAAAEKEQMEAASMARLLVPVEYVLNQLTEDYSGIKTALRKIPDAIAQNVEAAIAAHVREIADEIVREAIDKLKIEISDKPLEYER
ncbi:terminase small subunit [Neorhizobium galegae]|uniref:Phage DNA packaging Nu1 n=1 Tax=Neorhizobium galegae bv. orientalis str. HAMBI 540 TaxID=1028800 RepID=A0A068SKV9_NEOGA|nr:terminase small subunit [Neorhizobium galegae]MCQ1856028.1 terminase small subunit [Neorhizobium galegae]CDN46842.1 Phage DNA packaging Nu1 [Neorhizobium galegae bv. orientalis str. HAMBI 540]